MSSTTITENIPTLLSNFDITTGHTSGNLSWKIDFNGHGSTSFNEGFIESPIVYGQKILVNDVLSFQPSNTQLNIGAKKIYTNPGTSSIGLLTDVSTLSSFEININSFNRSTDYYFRSFDLFESISSDLLDDSYSTQEDFFGYSNDSIEIGVVLLKAPNQSKIRNPVHYLNQILTRGAIGSIGVNSIDPSCSSSLLSEDERIITLVYKKNGKYYDADGIEISKYVGSEDSINFNYFGSRGIGTLNLSNIGYDGRYIDGFTYDKRLISYESFINDNRAMNTIFYPKKEHNTVENVYSVNSNNPFKIISSVTAINNIQIISFTVVVNGNTYTTNPISIDNGGNKLSPLIRSRDFSKNPSFNISSIIATFSTGNQLDVNYGVYLKTNMPPAIYTTVNSVAVSNSTLIDSYPLVLTLLDLNTSNSTLSYQLTKNGVNYSSGTYSTPIDITTPGTYKITTYSINPIDSTKNSENVTCSIIVYKKAQSPTLYYNTLILDGVTDDHTTISFNSPDGIPVYFTTNGEIPNPNSGNCYIAHGSTTFNIYDSCVIKFYAFNGEYIKSDLVTETLNIVKTDTLPQPTISSINSIINSNRILLILNTSFTTPCEIYYTLDGTTPTKNSTKYTAGDKYIFPNHNSSSIVVNAISHLNGYNDSLVTTETFNFNFQCSPWNIEGEAIISNDSIILNDGAVITRNILMNPNYSLNFDVLENSGLGVLEISFDSLIGSLNNYSGEFSNSTNPIISTTYSGENYSIYALGVRRNKFDTGNYKKYGEIIVSTKDVLNVTYYLNYIPGFETETIKSNSNTEVTLPGTFYCKVKLANSFNKIETPWILISLDSIDYQRISTNSLIGGTDSSFNLGNLTFSCV